MNDIETLAPEFLTRAEPDRHNSRSTRIHRESIGAEPTVHKTARGGERSSLRREAEVLRAAESNVLVRLVDLVDGSESTELVLRDTGGPSLAGALADPDTTATDALSLLAAACDAVSRLHQHGWGHGRIEPDHVLLTARGRIRLCSLGAAVPIDVDPSANRADRVALLRMVDEWCRQPAGIGRNAPLSTRLRASALERRTHRLADDPDPQVLARILRRTARAGSMTEPGRVRRTAVAIGAFSIVACAALGSWTVLRQATESDALASSTPHASTTAPAAPTTSSTMEPSSATSDSEPPSATIAPATTVPATTVPATTVPATTVPATTVPATAGSTPVSATSASCTALDVQHPDVDGDGCGDAVHTDANAVVVGDRRYRLGADGDVVAVGDWNCDGTATPALLRPSTGSVFTFDHWATEATPSTATQIGTVEGAIGFAPNDGRCGAPRVVTSKGTIHAVVAGTVRP